MCGYTTTQTKRCWFSCTDDEKSVLYMSANYHKSYVKYWNWHNIIHKVPTIFQFTSDVNGGVYLVWNWVHVLWLPVSNYIYIIYTNIRKSSPENIPQSCFFLWCIHTDKLKRCSVDKKTLESLDMLHIKHKEFIYM